MLDFVSISMIYIFVSVKFYILINMVHVNNKYEIGDLVCCSSDLKIRYFVSSVVVEQRFYNDYDVFYRCRSVSPKGELSSDSLLFSEKQLILAPSVAIPDGYVQPTLF